MPGSFDDVLADMYCRLHQRLQLQADYSLMKFAQYAAQAQAQAALTGRQLRVTDVLRS